MRNMVSLLILITVFFAAALCGQTITVISPNGGENWALGTPVMITWTTSGISAGQLNIVLTKNDVQIGAIVRDVPYNGNSFPWNVGTLLGGESVAEGADYKIRIKLQGATTEDRSNANFAISLSRPQSITVSSPNGGESLQVGGPNQLIRWSHQNLASGSVSISLWKELSGGRTGLVGSVSASVPVTAGQYNWVVGEVSRVASSTETLTDGASYRIRVQHLETGISDDSDRGFTIAVPAQPPEQQPPQQSGTISIISPAAGRTVYSGGDCLITWNSPAGSDGVNEDIFISVWNREGNRFVPVTTLRNSAGMRSHTWHIPVQQFLNLWGEYRVRIKRVSDSRLLAESALFNISAGQGQEGAPPPAVSSPRNDLEIGPIYTADISLKRVSSYGGGNDVGSGFSKMRDKYELTINFRIRNNTGPDRPVIPSVPCSWTLMIKQTGMKQYINFDQQKGTFDIGPFESRRNGEWVRKSIKLTLYLDEYKIANEWKDLYYITFLIMPPVSVNDPTSSNNATRTPIFKNY